MNPGLLDRRITIQRETTAADEFGQAVATWKNWLINVPARRMESPGSEPEQQNRQRSKRRVLFCIRYVAGVTDSHRVVYEGQTLEILSVIEIKRRAFLEITCEGNG
ncbi:phage head closure protein [Cerasicoccus frondis]|uniref:phage head closure protein n=1 Tax=Cerasicoccus frondis TaxID=490090 RepID=UPI002852B13F|nr:phage head closure protein [Cerasicoccus frondis]